MLLVPVSFHQRSRCTLQIMMTKPEIFQSFVSLRYYPSNGFMLGSRHVSRVWLCGLVHLVSIESHLTPEKVLDIVIASDSSLIRLRRMLSMYHGMYKLIET